MSTYALYKLNSGFVCYVFTLEFQYQSSFFFLQVETPFDPFAQISQSS